jgi:hypothetical protein
MGRVTRKRLSEIKGNSFVAARILSSGETLSLPSGFVGKGQMPSSGLESSKAGFCWIYNNVFCSYQKSAESKMLGRCHSCPEMTRAVRETEEEDEEIWKELHEAWGRRVNVEKNVPCRYDGERCTFGQAVCDLPDEGRVSWFCHRKPKEQKSP